MSEMGIIGSHDFRTCRELIRLSNQNTQEFESEVSADTRPFVSLPELQR
jgi:hypothetical protein